MKPDRGSRPYDFSVLVSQSTVAHAKRKDQDFHKTHDRYVPSKAATLYSLKYWTNNGPEFRVLFDEIDNRVCIEGYVGAVRQEIG